MSDPTRMTAAALADALDAAARPVAPVAATAAAPVTA